MELAQVRLLVEDFPACYRFYRDVLGLRPQFDAETGPYAKFEPGEGSAGVALQSRTQMAEILDELGDEPTGHRSLVVLRVDDIGRCCEEIAARGAAPVHGPAPMTDRMLVAHFRDPEGNLVELQEWLVPRG